MPLANTQIYVLSLCWFGIDTDTSIKKSGGVKLFLWTQTPPHSGMMRSCTCFPRDSKMPTLAYKRANSDINERLMILTTVLFYSFLYCIFCYVWLTPLTFNIISVITLARHKSIGGEIRDTSRRRTILRAILHLPIPDLILKLYTFNILLFELFLLQRTKMSISCNIQPKWHIFFSYSV